MLQAADTDTADCRARMCADTVVAGGGSLRDRDRDFSARLLARDEGALSALMALYSSRCRRRAAEIVGSMDADDVIQEVFLRLWLKPTAYCPDRGGLLPWLLTVTRNCAVDVVRKQNLCAPRAEPLDEWEATADGPLEPDMVAETAETAASVRGAVAGLSHAQRETIVLTYFYDMSQVDIAAVMHVPNGTVKSRSSSARRELQRVLEPVA